VGKARVVDNPKEVHLIYRQLYTSRLDLGRDSLDQSNIVLPRGSMWVRERNDFLSKFVRIGGK